MFTKTSEMQGPLRAMNRSVTANGLGCVDRLEGGLYVSHHILATWQYLGYRFASSPSLKCI